MARGDVLLVALPTSDQREQSGQRPAVAVQADIAGEPMLMIAPVTSSQAALRFAFVVPIDPTPQNGLTVSSVVLVFQLRAIDKRRIIRKLGELSQKDMDKVDAEIWRMLRPFPPAPSSNEEGDE